MNERIEFVLNGVMCYLTFADSEYGTPQGWAKPEYLRAAGYWPDLPEHDATDAASPMWWRGQDNGSNGVEALKEKLRLTQNDARRMHYLGNVIRARSQEEQDELTRLMRKYPPLVEKPADTAQSHTCINTATTYDGSVLECAACRADPEKFPPVDPGAAFIAFGPDKVTPESLVEMVGGRLGKVSPEIARLCEQISVSVMAGDIGKPPIVTSDEAIEEYRSLLDKMPPGSVREALGYLCAAIEMGREELERTK